MYPFASLPANLAAFCDALRRAHGFHIGPAEVADAARALQVVPLADEMRVRDALRLVLCGRVQDVDVFDRAFADFFFPPRAGVQQEGLPPVGTPVRESEPAWAPAAERPARRSADRGGEAADEDDARGGSAVEAGDGGDEDANGMMLARASTSAATGQAPRLAKPDAAWRDAARALVRRVRLAGARRWRPAPRGVRFDLRRTLRASLHTGGEALTPRWLSRPRTSARFLLLIDGSRSMQACGEAPLRLAVALATATPRIEVFTFSTTIRRVTADVRAAGWATSRPLVGLEEAWGGGTTIGACLRELLRTTGDRLLSRNTCVIVVSDGLDAGDPAALAEAIHEIERRTAGLIWLNPLIGTPGYEPTATGMRIALPHVAIFARANDAAELEKLAGEVRLRR
jgi:uncharacterized protein